MDVEYTVRWLKDRELIKEVPQRYARGIDRIDFDLVRSAFPPRLPDLRDGHLRGP